jgi:hypothetical protein
VQAAWIAAGVCLIARGLLVWGIALETNACGVFGLPDGGLMATATPATWAAQLVFGAGARWSPSGAGWSIYRAAARCLIPTIRPTALSQRFAPG